MFCFYCPLFYFYLMSISLYCPVQGHFCQFHVSVSNPNFLHYKRAIYYTVQRGYCTRVRVKKSCHSFTQTPFIFSLIQSWIKSHFFQIFTWTSWTPHECSYKNPVTYNHNTKVTTVYLKYESSQTTFNNNNKFTTTTWTRSDLTVVSISESRRCKGGKGTSGTRSSTSLQIRTKTVR